MPKVFHVNWFGKDETTGGFLWPGFSDNCRVIDWILERCAGRADAAETPVGFVPTPGGLNLDGLEGFDEARIASLLKVDATLWKKEAAEIRKFFTETLMTGDDKPMPDQLIKQLESLERRVAEACSATDAA